MSLKHLGYIELPDHMGHGGFDHAAVDRGRALLYVAHTANDAVDMIDTRSGAYVHSVSGLKGVAGVLVHEPTSLVFTSNRGENTVSMFSSNIEQPAVKLPVGIRPNGLAYDPERGILLSANVGDPNMPGSPSVTVVNVRDQTVIATVPMPGRTRWASFDPDQQVFFVNIADPFRIVVLDPELPGWVARKRAQLRRPGAGTTWSRPRSVAEPALLRVR